MQRSDSAIKRSNRIYTAVCMTKFHMISAIALEIAATALLFSGDRALVNDHMETRFVLKGKKYLPSLTSSLQTKRQIAQQIAGVASFRLRGSLVEVHVYRCQFNRGFPEFCEPDNASPIGLSNAMEIEASGSMNTMTGYKICSSECKHHKREKPLLFNKQSAHCKPLVKLKMGFFPFQFLVRPRTIYGSNKFLRHERRSWGVPSSFHARMH